MSARNGITPFILVVTSSEGSYIFTNPNDRPFARAASRWATSAKNSHFAGCRKCHSRSLASHVFAGVQSQLRLAGMVEGATIGYHSGRSGRPGWIWSSPKFARPAPFLLVFRHSLTPSDLSVQRSKVFIPQIEIHKTNKTENVVHHALLQRRIFIAYWVFNAPLCRALSLAILPPS